LYSVAHELVDCQVFFSLDLLCQRVSEALKPLDATTRKAWINEHIGKVWEVQYKHRSLCAKELWEVYQRVYRNEPDAFTKGFEFWRRRELWEKVVNRLNHAWKCFAKVSIKWRIDTGKNLPNRTNEIYVDWRLEINSEDVADFLNLPFDRRPRLPRKTLPPRNHTRNKRARLQELEQPADRDEAQDDEEQQQQHAAQRRHQEHDVHDEADGNSDNEELQE
jgi:hypothetical protein